MDAYDLHSGNGNNLSGYANAQIDGIISALAVSADPAERARLLAEAAPVLWDEMPTLPLYRQQRTLLMSTKMYAVSRNPTRWGQGGTWIAGRWRGDDGQCHLQVIDRIPRREADLSERSVAGAPGCLGEDVCHGGTWAGDYVLNVIATGLSLKARGSAAGSVGSTTGGYWRSVSPAGAQPYLWPTWLRR